MNTEITLRPAKTHTLDEYQVGYHMSRTIVTVRTGRSLMTAFRKMARYNIGCLPVMSGSRMIGIVTDQLLIRCAAEGVGYDTPVEDISIAPHSVKRDDSIHHAIEVMRTHHIQHLPIITENGRLKGLVSQTDLLEASRRMLMHAEEKYREAEVAAYRDVLTGLYTRRVFENAFEREFTRAGTYSGLLSVMFMDLDRFKAVNDTHGHPAGDEVLKVTGSIVRECVRHVDIPCRFGGDEFVVLMPESGTRAATIVAEEICRMLREERFTGPEEEFTVSASVGICKWIEAFERPRDMLAAADRCLYRAKSQGRDRIVIQE